MLKPLTKLIATGLLVVLAACGSPPSKFKSYDGPPVTQLVVNKSKRQLIVLSGPKVIKTYNVGLGYAPDGNKNFEGDGKTPEGAYFIDRRNPNSRYHLSLGISYPNDQDKARALAQGGIAGSDIFIHGRGPEGNALSKSKKDWTVGCVAISDKEIEDLYAMVPDGTPIQINP